MKTASVPETDQRTGKQKASGQRRIPDRTGIYRQHSEQSEVEAREQNAANRTKERGGTPFLPEQARRRDKHAEAVEYSHDTSPFPIPADFAETAPRHAGTGEPEHCCAISPYSQTDCRTVHEKPFPRNRTEQRKSGREKNTGRQSFGQQQPAEAEHRRIAGRAAQEEPAAEPFPSVMFHFHLPFGA